MITEEELVEITKRTGMKPYQQEKHYVQTIVLSSMYSVLSNESVFKGGTSLMLFYGLNRFSKDLDFTITKSIPIEKVKDEVRKTFEFLDMNPQIKDIVSKTGINFRVGVRGPLFKSEIHRCYVRIEISERADVILSTETKENFPYYPDISPFSVVVMDPVEIASEKVRAILKRDYARDVYDLWFLIKKGYPPDMNIVEKKMAYYNEKFDSKVFRKKLMEKKNAWESELRPLIIGRLPEFEECRKAIEKLKIWQ